MNPVERVLGDIYSSTEPLDLVVELCDEYDSRWPGSGMDKQSCEYMAGKMRGYGLENVHLEKFTIPGWIRDTSSLSLTEPKSKDIDWKSTFTSAIDMNKVWKPKGQQETTNRWVSQ